jgi:hypothetical protein
MCYARPLQVIPSKNVFNGAVGCLNRYFLYFPPNKDAEKKKNTAVLLTMMQVAT